MKTTFLLVALSLLCASLGSAEEKLIFQTTPNKTSFPFPSALPATKDRSSFDWERYLAAANSKADRLFRAHLAPQSVRFKILGAGSSNSDEYVRYNLAATELKARCEQLLDRYRRKLADQEELLARLNAYAKHRKGALDAHVALVGGSWGGSGARVAMARSRAHSFANYLHDLDALSASLHLQDLPD